MTAAGWPGVDLPGHPWSPLHAGGADEAVRFPPGDLVIAAFVLAALAAVGFAIHHVVRRRRSR